MIRSLMGLAEPKDKPIAQITISGPLKCLNDLSHLLLIGRRDPGRGGNTQVQVQRCSCLPTQAEFKGVAALQHPGWLDRLLLKEAGQEPIKSHLIAQAAMIEVLLAGLPIQAIFQGGAKGSCRAILVPHR